ncbi:MAG: glycosyltransferase [Chloroflexi bacterium]|nr:glycosyltransferase [Chloroflexota bacterium]
MMSVKPARVSLVATLLNEAKSVRALLASIDKQTRRPDEVVLVDGGSNDGTLELLEQWAADRSEARILSAPGATIAQGRNLAIRAASHELIAVTDAGVTLDPAWLARLAASLEDDPSVSVAGGFFVAETQGSFEQAMGATVLPAREDIDGESFLPSSRSVAFRRSAWEKVGGYPEWLDYCEDVVFDLQLRRAGYRFTWDPDAVVRFRPRSNLRAFLVQYYRYARGDGKADLWRRRHAVRYVAYLCGVALMARPHPLTFLALLVAGSWYLRRPVERLLAQASRHRREALLALLLIPLIRATGDVAKMLGYPAGVIWRLRQRRPA